MTIVDKEKIQEAIKKIESALQELEDVVGEEGFNFVGSLLIFDEKDEVADDSLWWSVGDIDTCVVSAESLLEDCKREQREDELFNINLN